MNRHLNHGSTTAQPYGCRICHENEKKAFATVMRMTGQPPVRIAGWAINVENLQRRRLLLLLP
jgi:hypothetical protein